MSGTSVSYTAQQIANMPLAQQQQVISQLSPQDQQNVQQALVQKTLTNNKMTMRNSRRQWLACPVTGGNVTSATYNAGQTLSFDIPLLSGGYCLGALVTMALTVNPATGSSATYAKTPSAPYSAFQEVDVLYNGAQIKSSPYIEGAIFSETLKYASYLNNGIGAISNANSVAVTNDIAGIDTAIYGTCPITVNTNNTWNYKFFVSFNKIARDDVRGILPMNGIGTRGQFKLVCAPLFLGPDPLQNAIYSTGGTGNAVTVTGSVNVDLLTINGSNMQSTKNLTIDLNNESTLQGFWDSPLAPLTASLLVKKQLSVLLNHYQVVALIIDGVQSNAFSTLSNLTQLALAPDASSNNYLWHIGVSDNLSINDFYWEMRSIYGQDFPIGVIPFVDACSYGIPDAGTRHGTQALNMKSGGYPGANFCALVNAVGSVCTPRIEIFYPMAENTDGLGIKGA